MQQQKPAAAATPVKVVARNEMRPVYHYADSFWCTYIISVVSANIAEMGKLLRILSSPDEITLAVTRRCSHLPSGFDQSSPAGPRRGEGQCCERSQVKGKRISPIGSSPDSRAIFSDPIQRHDGNGRRNSAGRRIVEAVARRDAGSVPPLSL